METQLGQLVAHIPRQSGSLPSQPEVNPKGQSSGHIAAIHLRSGRDLQECEHKPEEEDAEKAVDVDHQTAHLMSANPCRCRPYSKSRPEAEYISRCRPP